MAAAATGRIVPFAEVYSDPSDAVAGKFVLPEAVASCCCYCHQRFAAENVPGHDADTGEAGRKMAEPQSWTEAQSFGPSWVKAERRIRLALAATMIVGTAVDGKVALLAVAGRSGEFAGRLGCWPAIFDTVAAGV